MGGQNGFFGMGDHTRPFAAHDLMMQMPLIFRHPGQIPAGTNDQLVANYDLLPILLDFEGLSDELLSELAEQLHAFFGKYAESEYDIWRGGRSKARRLYAPEDHPDYRPLRR